MSLDHNEPDEDEWIDPDDERYFEQEDWPMRTYLGDAVRIGAGVVLVWSATRIAQYMWTFLRFVIPT